MLMKAGVPHTDRDAKGMTPVDLLEGNKEQIWFVGVVVVVDDDDVVMVIISYAQIIRQQLSLLF